MNNSTSPLPNQCHSCGALPGERHRFGCTPFVQPLSQVWCLLHHSSDVQSGWLTLSDDYGTFVLCDVRQNQSDSSLHYEPLTRSSLPVFKV